jgi:outer membrane protein TolC
MAQAGLQSASEAFRLVQEQYRQGAATVTRYLEAEADRSQAEIRHVLTQYQNQTSRADLHQALGTWK